MVESIARFDRVVTGGGRRGCDQDTKTPLRDGTVLSRPLKTSCKTLSCCLAAIRL
jgi:hypothetical protein